MAVDAVPHDLADESSDLTETLHPVELGHAHRHLVAAHLGDQLAAAGGDEVGLPGCGAKPGVRFHALHQQLEIPLRKIEVEIKLAEIIELPERDRLEASVEGFDHAGADAATAAIRPAHHP